MNGQVKRGEIWLVNLGEVSGNSSIQKGVCRPCVIVSNDTANQFSPVINVLPMTTKIKNPLPTHVLIGIETGLKCESLVMAEQSMLISKEMLIRKVGSCNSKIMHKLDRAILIQFGLFDKVMNSIKSAVNKSKNKSKGLCACA